MTDFALARRNMVDGQLRPNRVTNTSLLAAIGELPRERFLPEGLRSVAYADDDVPLGNGRFLMEPMVLARLLQALQPQPDDKALVVASGRGYGQTVAKLEAGAPGEAPYDAILVEGAVHEIPRAILDQLAEGGRLTTVIAAAAGVLGVAQLVMKEGGTTSGRPLFDAGTLALPGFAPPPRFTF
jgi:protein-L-isoaspartate(D-aspartate) O-methyltransferase